MNFSHIHHVSSSYLEEFFKNYSPVFILNTGRSGSALLQDVFTNYDNIDAFHEAHPTLFLLPNYAYHNQGEGKILENIFRAARTELLLTSKVNSKIYLETNQCLVFFAYQILKVFPNAKFVHLTRHPGDFVRSGIMKGWHKNDSVWEMGRIRMKDEIEWSKLTQLQKLSWVWRETHGFIERFKETVNSNGIFTVKLEDLIKKREIFNELLNFIGSNREATPKEFTNLFKRKLNKIEISSNEPDNMFKLAKYPNYEHWNEDEKSQLKEATNSLCKLYEYTL